MQGLATTIHQSWTSLALLLQTHPQQTLNRRQMPLKDNTSPSTNPGSRVQQT